MPSKPKADPKDYQELVQQRLRQVEEVFVRAAVGDFSTQIEIPEVEDEFTDLIVGTKLMLDVINEKIDELQNVNANLETVVAEKQRALAEAQSIAHLGSWEWDVPRDVMRWSNELHHIYGIPKDKLQPTYRGCLSLVHPEDQDEFNRVVEHAYRDLDEYELVHRILRKGQIRYLQLKGHVHRDANGEVIRMLGTALDITNMKRAEEKIKMEATYVKLMQGIAVAANEARSVEEVVRVCLENVCELMHWPLGHYYRVGGKDSELLLPSGIWYVEDAKRYRSFIELTNKTVLGLNEGMPGKAMANRRPEWDAHLGHGDSAFTRMAPKVRATIRSGFAAPIFLDNQPIGVMEFFSNAPETGNKRFLELMTNVSSQLARVAERVAAGQALVRSEERMRTLLETIPDGIIILAKDGQIKMINEGTERLFGYERDSLIGQHVKILLDKVEHDSADRKLEWLFEHGPNLNKGRSYELVGVHGRHGSFPMEVNFGFIHLEEGPHLSITVRDISDRKRIEATIKKLSLVASRTDNAVIITDANGIIEWVNDGFCNMTGYEPDDVIGRHAAITRGAKISTAQQKKLAEDLTQELITTGRALTYEVQNVKKNGEKYWVLTTLSPIYNRQGRIQNLVSIDSNITTLKQTQEELSAAKEIAEESLKVKQQFLANMSHEIRTPLNGILGFARLLEDTTLDSEQSEFVEIIRSSGDNLMQIINDILDLSKMEAGKLDLEDAPFDIFEVGRNAVNILQERAQGKGLELKTRFDPKIPSRVSGDALRLNQILINLLGNAIKFTEEGSVGLDVSLKAKEDDTYRIAFEVRDTGVGIPKSKLDSIFQSFTQASNATTREFGGTGLGLTISRELVTLQGGQLYVESEPGKGSVFTFEIPYRRSRQAQFRRIRKSVMPQKEELKGVRVLLVEDNLVNRHLASTLLSRWGCEVTPAENGQLALEQLKSGSFDIVLMDIQMPVMDGYEATQHIRKELKLTDLPVIGLTAHAMKGEAERAHDAGMDAYISKPFKPEELSAAIIDFVVGRAGNTAKNA